MQNADIFASCVSDDFEKPQGRFPGFRSALAAYLRRADCNVKVQEDFRQEGAIDTMQKLANYIRGCRAVLHLIGDTDRLSKLANAVLHACSHIELEGQDSIWVLASEGDAPLLLGDTESSVRFYRSALSKILAHHTGIIQSMYNQLCRLHWALGEEIVGPVVNLSESNGRLVNVIAGPFGDCDR